MLEGLTWNHLQAEALLHNCKKREYVPDGGETLAELRSRVHDFFRGLCDQLEREVEESRHSNSNKKSDKQHSSQQQQVVGVSGEAGVNNNSRPDNHLRNQLIGSMGCDDSSPEPGARVLVVTHGGVIRELLHHFVNGLDCTVSWVGGKDAALRTSPNCALSRFLITTDVSTSDGGVKVTCLELFNVDHLQQTVVESFFLSSITANLVFFIYRCWKK